jgi:hypothetical protein
MDDLLSGRRDKFPSYFDSNNYIQHNPWVADNLTGLVPGCRALASRLGVKYDRVHNVLGKAISYWSWPRARSEIAHGVLRFVPNSEREDCRNTGIPWKRSRRAPGGRNSNGKF